MSWIQLLFSPEGRLGRRDFWIGVCILLGAGLIASRIPLINGLVGLVTTYCLVCLGSRRLHDLGLSGLWLLLPIGLWIASFVIGLSLIGVSAFQTVITGGLDLKLAAGGVLAFGVFMIIAVLVVTGFFVWAGLKTGEPQTNRHGPVPTDFFALGGTPTVAAAPLPDSKPDED